MTPDQLAKLKKKIAPVVKKSKVEYLGVFGSYARGEAKKGSDVDMLVRFCKPVNLVELIELEAQFSRCLGKKVDLVTENSLSPYMKPYILKDLKAIHEG